MTKFASKALTLKEKSTRKKKCNHESRISGAKFFNFRTFVSFLRLVVLCGQRACRLLYQFKFESHWNVHFSVKCCLKGTNRDRGWPSSPNSSNLFSLCAPFLYFSQYNLIFPLDQFLQFCQLCFSIILSVLSSHSKSGFLSLERGIKFIICLSFNLPPCFCVSFHTMFIVASASA